MKVVEQQLTKSFQVPIPFSVFPSSYRSDTVTQSTEVKVEEQVNPPTSHGGREGHETRYTSTQAPPSRRVEEEIRVTEEDRFRRPVREEKVHIYEEDRQPRRRNTKVEIEENRYREPYQRYVDAQIDVQDRAYDRHDRHFPTTHGPATHLGSEFDSAERDYRQRTNHIVQDSYSRDNAGAYTQDLPQAPPAPRTSTKGTAARDYYYSQPNQEEVRVGTETRSTVDSHKQRKLDMGYVDNKGNYHSFRQGLKHAAEHIRHPIHGPHHHHHNHQATVSPSYPAPKPEYEEEIIEERPAVAPPTMSAPRRNRGPSANSISIPCHHIRIGDLLILQGRPCQVIRITTSAQTGQHRYLGVDLFTKQLQEESSFISNPSPSVVVQQMYGPVFKQYRVLDIRDDGAVVAMTESGDVKQGLPVLDQSNLTQRLTDAFDEGRGSVRVLVIDDDGYEMAVDYRIVHGSRL